MTIVTMLRRRTVLAIANLAESCFEYFTVSDGKTNDHVRTDWFGDMLFEKEHDLVLVSALRALPLQRGVVKNFVLGIYAGHALALVVASKQQFRGGLPPINPSDVAQELLQKLAVDLLEYAHRPREKTLVHVDKGRVAELLESLKLDGFRWQDGHLLRSVDNAPGGRSSNGSESVLQTPVHTSTSPRGPQRTRGPDEVQESSIVGMTLQDDLATIKIATDDIYEHAQQLNGALANAYANQYLPLLFRESLKLIDGALPKVLPRIQNEMTLRGELKSLCSAAAAADREAEKLMLGSSDARPLKALLRIVLSSARLVSTCITQLLPKVADAPHRVSGGATTTSAGQVHGGEQRAHDVAERPKAGFGIVAALPYEFAAIKVMLEDSAEWNKPGSGAGRRYVVGNIPSRHGRSHKVAAVLLPDTGNNQASARATLLLEHFPEIKHVIMCGIAGGIPRPGEPEHDVRLGDVVISDRGGVIQYDFGKQEGNRWSARSAPRPPGAALLEAVRYLKAEEHEGKRPWEDYVGRCSLIENALRPSDNESAKGRHLSYPPDTLRRNGHPRIFLAPIASSGTLLKNEDKRDELGQEYGVKAVEMEGSGIADAAWFQGEGYLVVRGIVDYCDLEKGDRWHHYSAVAAAAYLRALIESMPVAS